MFRFIYRIFISFIYSFYFFYYLYFFSFISFTTFFIALFNFWYLLIIYLFKCLSSFTCCSCWSIFHVLFLLKYTFQPFIRASCDCVFCIVDFPCIRWLDFRIFAPKIVESWNDMIKLLEQKWKSRPVGLEPTIAWLEVKRLIH